MKKALRLQQEMDGWGRRLQYGLQREIKEKKDKENRLITNSLIKIKQISSFDKRRFFKLVGIANHEIMNEVKNNLMTFLI